MRRIQINVGVAVTLLAALLSGGTIGYHLIEGWSLIDSLYMTFITLTTVGFGEVHPLSAAGRQFTIVFLIFSVATVGFSISTLITYLFEGQIVASVREARMKRQLGRIRNHYIVCGGGDVGREVVREFRASDTPHVVIDRDPAHCELADDQNDDTIIIGGDASEEAILNTARISEAAGLVAVLPSDADNVFVTLTARQMNPKLTIVAKGTDEHATSKLRRAGANRVITPAQIAGRRIASTILRPSVVNFLDVIVDDSEVSMRIEEFSVRPDSRVAGHTLREAAIGEHTGAIVLTISDRFGTPRTDASRAGISSITINADDRIIALGSEVQLDDLRRLVE